MSIDSIIKLTSNPTIDDVIKVLKTNKRITNVSKGKETQEYGGITYSRIDIDYDNNGVNEHRGLTVLYNTKDVKEDGYENESYEYTKGKKYTNISLNYSGSYKEILTYIISYFGGYFIDNDIDYVFKKIEKSRELKSISRIEDKSVIKKLNLNDGYNLTF